MGNPTAAPANPKPPYIPVNYTPRLFNRDFIQNEWGRCKNYLYKHIVAQDPAISAVLEMYKTDLAGISPSNRPLGNFLFLGPTGTGKTRLVEAFAESLYGDTGAVIKINCGEFQEKHEIAKLIGSPPGYMGHKETDPLITQEALERRYTRNTKVNIVLFDEIEKAHESLRQLLLGPLDKGFLNLGDNTRIDFRRSMIFMTSNLGADKMGQRAWGFGVAPDPKETQERENAAVIQVVRRKFSAEFMNRMDHTVVFERLDNEALHHIVDIEIGLVMGRYAKALQNESFRIGLTSEAKDFIIQEAFAQPGAARELKRVIERRVVHPVLQFLLRKPDAPFVAIEYNGRSDNLHCRAVSPGELSRRQADRSLAARQAPRRLAATR